MGGIRRKALQEAGAVFDFDELEVEGQASEIDQRDSSQRGSDFESTAGPISDADEEISKQVGKQSDPKKQASSTSRTALHKDSKKAKPQAFGMPEKSVPAVLGGWTADDHEGIDMDYLTGKLQRLKGMEGSKQSPARAEQSASLAREHGDSLKTDLQLRTAVVTATVPPAYKNPANPLRFEKSIPRARPAAKDLAQNAFVGRTASIEILNAAMPPHEGEAREKLRVVLRKTCRDVVAEIEHSLGNANFTREEVHLKPVGSMNDGLGLMHSDLDLLVAAPEAQCLTNFDIADLPRSLCRELLDNKLGVHVFTSLTGDVSIRGCTSPTPVLFEILNRKWAESDEKAKEQQADELLVRSYRKALNGHFFNSSELPRVMAFMAAVENSDVADGKDPEVEARREAIETVRDVPWHFQEREPRRIEIPEDMGIRFNIQFRNPLGLFNARLLRCYSLCDVRFRELTVFVRSWAKKRDISSPARGTLSHYGYLLMVLHFCINIASPPLFPNLQQEWKNKTGDKNMQIECNGYDVRFWQDEGAIDKARERGKLSYNDQPLAVLIREFFHYYSGYPGLFAPPFHWRDQVIAVKADGGLALKKELGWVEAKIKQIRPFNKPGAEPVIVRIPHSLLPLWNRIH